MCIEQYCHVCELKQDRCCHFTSFTLKVCCAASLHGCIQELQMCTVKAEYHNQHNCHDGLMSIMLCTLRLHLVGYCLVIILADTSDSC